MNGRKHAYSPLTYTACLFFLLAERDNWYRTQCQVSFQEGRVVVATRVEATTPFAVPDLNNDNATPQNSALIVTGFTETIAEVIFL